VGQVRQRRARVAWWALALVFVVLPIVEIYVLIQIGQVIGAWWTILLLVADGVAGSLLVKHEGRRAWRALRVALDSGRMPAKELLDGALVLVGGTLLIAPGFVTDVFGALFLLPFTRPVVRRVVVAYATRRMLTRRRPGHPPDTERVVRGEVVD